MDLRAFGFGLVFNPCGSVKIGGPEFDLGDLSELGDEMSLLAPRLSFGKPAAAQLLLGNV